MFNVVGYFNYRYFFNFLWFVIIAMSYGAAISYQPFMNLGSPAYREQLKAADGWGKLKFKDLVVRHSFSNAFIPTPAERTLIAVSFMLCLCLAAAVMCLGIFHLYLVLNALTTIEFHGAWSKKRKGKWQNPYSTGSWKSNWDMVYGTQYWSHYKRFWRPLLAMMPSKREPEFLPFPISGKLVRRQNSGTDETKYQNMDDVKDEDLDLEAADFLMTTKKLTSRLAERSRTQRPKKQRVV